MMMMIIIIIIIITIIVITYTNLNKVQEFRLGREGIA
jgi:hypothetical protein